MTNVFSDFFSRILIQCIVLFVGLWSVLWTITVLLDVVRDKIREGDYRFSFPLAPHTVQAFSEIDDIQGLNCCGGSSKRVVQRARLVVHPVV